MLFRSNLNVSTTKIRGILKEYNIDLVNHLSILPIKEIYYRHILGGEKLSSSIISKIQNLYDRKNNISLTIYDEYGPTEATVGTCNSQVYPNKNRAIGKPYNNYKVYVLDKNLRPLPIGAIGELYIGGVGLARGYLNRPELTAEKFIANPFRSELEGVESKDTRLYKTGDLVRWLPDGNLEYIGRNDFQVKIRGYRIELGEIESILSTYAGISQSVVIAKEHVDIEGVTTGNKYLVGYYVSKVRLNEEKIINYLGSRLPEYMIPSILVYLEKLPLTINGKLDRKALPDPEFTNIDNYVAPRNELESQVCKIWLLVLLMMVVLMMLLLMSVLLLLSLMMLLLVLIMVMLLLLLLLMLMLLLMSVLLLLSLMMLLLVLIMVMLLLLLLWMLLS